jgi:hypothetical protein
MEIVMDKKSGVYYHLTDSSLRVGGSSLFGGILPMYTVKGELGKLIKVTAKDFRSKLGFDLEYNPNYYGLDKILSSVASIEVLRCNKNPTIAYKLWDATGFSASWAPYGSVDALVYGATSGQVWVACSTPGSWGNDTFICFSCDGTIGDLAAIYTMHQYTISQGVPSPIGTYEFSLDPDSDKYYQNVYFGDFQFGFKGDFPVASAFFPDISEGLPNGSENKIFPGSNGDTLSSALDVNEVFPAIDKSSANVVVMNGFIEDPMADKAVIQAIVSYCGNQDRSVLLDAPVTLDEKGILRANDDLFSWTNSLLNKETGHYAQVAARPDVVEVDGQTILVQPSVFLFQIYANMFANYGSINYPPAGVTYGSVMVNSLIDSDFHLLGDELKTNRVNYLTDTSNGVCMWEYRTLYNLGGSDLSYANTPYILRDLKGRLLSFMEPSTFKYSTPIDLLTIQSGLDSILGFFKDNYFLVNYTLNVPSFEEAQAAGRELNIDMGVSVINSTDVITLRVTLQNAATLRAG